MDYPSGCHTPALVSNQVDSPRTTGPSAHASRLMPDRRPAIGCGELLQPVASARQPTDSSSKIDRKYVASIQLTIAFAGSCISARSSGINELIGGGILIGFGLSSLGIIVAIPAEVLPLKYRAIANGANFLGGALGGV